MNMTDVSPDRNDPFPNRSFADIVTSIEEAPTGSIHDRSRGQQLSGLDRQRADLREELRHSRIFLVRSATSSTAKRFEGAASRS